MKLAIFLTMQSFQTRRPLLYGAFYSNSEVTHPGDQGTGASSQGQDPGATPVSPGVMLMLAGCDSLITGEQQS